MVNLPIEQAGVEEERSRGGVFFFFQQWAPILLLFLLLGVSYYAYSTRNMLEERIAAVERASSERVTNEVKALNSEASTLASSLETLDGRVGTTVQELNSTSKMAANLKSTQDRLAKTVAANSAGVTAVRDETVAQIAAVNTNVGTVSSDIKNLATRVDSTGTDIAAGRRELTDTAARLSSQIAKNADDVATLRRKGEQDVFEFDIQKSGGNDVARVEDVRIQLTKADVRNGKYNVILVMNDRRIEKKDLLVNEPVQFVVGKERLRYELVVTAVDHDRIRGYVSVPKEGLPMTARSVS